MELVDTCTNTTSRILVVQYLTIFFFFPFSKKKKTREIALLLQAEEGNCEATEVEEVDPSPGFEKKDYRSRRRR